IDERFHTEEEVPVCSTEFLCWIHREFYERVPESFLNIYHPDRAEHIIMTPGELRKDNVKIGNHIPPEWNFIPDFLKRFEEVYASEKVLGHKKLLAAAA